VRDDLEGARKVLAELAELGISMDEVTAELEAEGVKKFADSFVDLLAAIEERRKALAVIWARQAVAAMQPSSVLGAPA
jgi:hypothetical protein